MPDFEHKDRAACRDVDPELFFVRDTSKAKEVCDVCDVRDECLYFAASHIDEQVACVGVWGGLSGDRLWKTIRLLREGMPAWRAA